MKVRTGFVSNSSSSSFAIVMAKSDYAMALEELPADIQQFINHHCQPESKELGGCEMVLVSGVYGDEQYLNRSEFNPRPNEDYQSPFNRYSAIRKVMDTLKKQPHLYSETN